MGALPIFCGLDLLDHANSKPHGVFDPPLEGRLIRIFLATAYSAVLIGNNFFKSFKATHVDVPSVHLTSWRHPCVVILGF
jgi:hypothetical protein